MIKGKLTGIILAGGNSSRMGTNKAFVEINGMAMILFVYNLLRLYCSEIIISTNSPESYSFLNHKKVADEKKGIGPIGGIISCLKQSSNRKNLVIACDMPNVSPYLIQLMLRLKNMGQFIVPVSDERIEPLCAIYDKSVIPFLEEMVKDGDYKVSDLQHYCETYFIPFNDDNNSFYNVNSPSDLNEKL